MNSKKMAVIASIFFLAFCFSFSAFAAVPKLLTYQGVLKDASNNYLTGTYSMVFKVYDVSTGGTALWTETQSSVSASSGRFSVILGSVTTLSLAFDRDYWLSVKVGTDAEMTPRVRLTSSGYSLMADQLINGFSQAQHDILSHKNVEGVKDATLNIAKTNFKLDAYSSAAANSMGDMVMDTFTDASGISSGSSTNYTWRGSSNFDVIVTPATGGIDSYTKLMLHTNGTDASTTFTDSSDTPKTVTANGNAQIDTAQLKFGSASGLFDGTGDYLTTPDHADFDFGTGDFTIDFWVRFNSLASYMVLYSKGGGGTNDIHIDWQPDGINALEVTMYYQHNFSWLPEVNTWYHVAVTRSGSSLRAFVNGIQIGSTATNSQDITNATQVVVGASTSLTSPINGWIDELRISKGVARWTANFTPESAEYTVPGSQGNATVTSVTWSEPAAPTEAMVIPDETLGTGSITYYVSRDNGTTWTQCTKNTVTSITSQPSGTSLRWKAEMSGNAELNAIAVAV